MMASKYSDMIFINYKGKNIDVALEKLRRTSDIISNKTC